MKVQEQKYKQDCTEHMNRIGTRINRTTSVDRFAVLIEFRWSRQVTIIHKRL